MLTYFIEFLRDQPVLVFFLVLSLGYRARNRPVTLRLAGVRPRAIGGALGTDGTGPAYVHGRCRPEFRW